MHNSTAIHPHIKLPIKRVARILKLSTIRPIFQPLVLSCLLAIPLITQAEMDISQDLSDLTPEERAWLEDDSALDAMTVNDGQINWVSADQTTGKYYLENKITVIPDSLKTGWVRFIQCHNQLDPFYKVEVQYHSENTRNLQVQSHDLIDKVNIDNVNQAAVLIEVKKGAKVCISGESKTMKANDKGYVIQRGPYMRKFLDGYYPMYLKESLDWSQTPIELEQTNIQTQPGRSFQYSQANKTLTAEYWFEGRLMPTYEYIDKNK